MVGVVGLSSLPSWKISDFDRDVFRRWSSVFTAIQNRYNTKCIRRESLDEFSPGNRTSSKASDGAVDAETAAELLHYFWTLAVLRFLYVGCQGSLLWTCSRILPEKGMRILVETSNCSQRLVGSHWRLVQPCGKTKCCPLQFRCRPKVARGKRSAPFCLDFGRSYCTFIQKNLQNRRCLLQKGVRTWWIVLGKRRSVCEKSREGF